MGTDRPSSRAGSTTPMRGPTASRLQVQDEPALPTKFYPTDTLRHTMGLIKKHGRMDWKNERTSSASKAEINLLHKNGTIDLLPYFFIDEEVCSLYEANGLLTGPGRGSAAGLLLTYLLGITHVDPLKFDLSMDRFITLDRIKTGKLPDIDQDLPNRDPLVDPGQRVAEASASATTTRRSRRHHAQAALRGQGRGARCARARPARHRGAHEEVRRTSRRASTDQDFVFGYEDSGDWVDGVDRHGQGPPGVHPGQYPRSGRSSRSASASRARSRATPARTSSPTSPSRTFIPTDDDVSDVPVHPVHGRVRRGGRAAQDGLPRHQLAQGHRRRHQADPGAQRRSTCPRWGYLEGQRRVSPDARRPAAGTCSTTSGTCPRTRPSSATCARARRRRCSSSTRRALQQWLKNFDHEEVARTSRRSIRSRP
jgi:hypothetical protein